jgi:TRAP-type C4-dicarboxylate transport system substrate-binding protein
LAALAFWSTGTVAQTVLRFNIWLPPKHFIVTEGFEGWAADVQRVTEGRVNVTMTTKSLGAPPRQFDLSAEGVVDVSWGVQGYTPGRFISSEMVELPFLGDSAEALSVAYWRTYQKHFAAADEYAGVKLLTLHVHPPGHVVAYKKPIRRMADLDGVKIRIVNPVTSTILEHFGGVPVSAPAPNSYDLFSKGVIDGTFISYDGVKSFRLQDFSKQFLEVPGGLYNTSFFIVMNQAKWDSLSAQDRKSIEEVSGEYYARRMGRLWDQIDREGRQLVLDSGGTITPVSGDDLKQLEAALAPIEEAWIQRATDKGLAARAALDMLRAEVANYAR